MTRARTIAEGADTSNFLTATSNLDAAKLTTGTIPNARYGTPTFSAANLTSLPSGGDNTPYFYVSIPVGQSISTGATTQINFSEELLDSGGVYNTSSKQFLPTTAGYYHIFAQATMDTDTDFNQFRIAIRKNGSVIALGGHDNDSRNSVSTSFLVHLNGSSDYIDATAMQNSGGNASLGSGDSETFMYGFKLAE